MDTPEIAIVPECIPATETSQQPGAMALNCLRRLASRYVWWKTPDEAMRFPDRVAAQVMNLGTFEDLTQMIESAGEDYLRGVLRHADAGQLDARSWHYWHYRLGLAKFGERPVPPMPVRKTA